MKIGKVSVFLITVLGLLALSVSNALPSFAQESVSLTVSPPSFDFGLNPGVSESNVIKVINPSNVEVELEARVENILGTTDIGQVRFTEEETEFSLSSWVTVSPSRFRLKAGESKTISFTIKVPANAEPGGHYGSILIGTIAAEGGGTGSAIVQRVGSLLLVRVSGKANETAAMAGFTTKTFVGAWDEIKSQDNTTTYFIPKEEKNDLEKPVSYFSKGPVAFDLAIKNNGNVHIRPVGFVTIYNMFGKKVTQLAIEPRNVFPGVERKITVLWPKTNLWGGYYKAQLVAVYGQGNQSLTSTTTFWAFPLIPSILIAAFIIFVIVARKRLAKVIRVLLKG